LHRSTFCTIQKKRKIEIKKDASETVCFPFRCNDYLKASNNIEYFIKELKNLTEKFYPITICLHHCDIEDGKHLEYIKKRISSSFCRK
jgi:hypothetical protein